MTCGDRESETCPYSVRGAGSVFAFLAHAQLVALRVLEDRPGDAVLGHRVGFAARRPQADQSLDFGLTVIGAEVEVRTEAGDLWVASSLK